jgi:hypothetical protein
MYSYLDRKTKFCKQTIHIIFSFFSNGAGALDGRLWRIFMSPFRAELSRPRRWCWLEASRTASVPCLYQPFVNSIVHFASSNTYGAPVDRVLCFNLQSEEWLKAIEGPLTCRRGKSASPSAWFKRRYAGPTTYSPTSSLAGVGGGGCCGVVASYLSGCGWGCCYGDAIVGGGGDAESTAGGCGESCCSGPSLSNGKEEVELLWPTGLVSSVSLFLLYLVCSLYLQICMQRFLLLFREPHHM